MVYIFLYEIQIFDKVCAFDSTSGVFGILDPQTQYTLNLCYWMPTLRIRSGMSSVNYSNLWSECHRLKFQLYCPCEDDTILLSPTCSHIPISGLGTSLLKMMSKSTCIQMSV